MITVDAPITEHVDRNEVLRDRIEEVFKVSSEYKNSVFGNTVKYDVLSIPDYA